MLVGSWASNLMGQDSVRTNRLSGFFRGIAVGAVVSFIRAYQWAIRPHLVGACKFCPTCSEYAIEALHTHGVGRGGWMALRRLGRCRPFTRGGLDLVPPPDHRMSAPSHAS